MGDGGRLVTIGVANGVKESVVLVLVALAGRLVEQLLLRVTLGGSSVTAAPDVLGEEFLGFVGVVV